MESGANLTLAQIQPLADQVLEHKCKTCGSATVNWGNSPKDGYLTFNYVEDSFCDGDCISGDGSAVANSKREVGKFEKRRVKGWETGSEDVDVRGSEGNMSP